MIRHIACKEVLENLVSLRFALSLLLTLSLFAVCGYVSVNGYREQSQDYWRRTNKNLAVLRDQSDALYEVAFYEQEIQRRPKPLSVCAAGDEKTLPNSFRVNAFTADLPKIQGQMGSSLSHFGSLDWVLIVSLILSFAAMLFTYDSICGEKEGGTLRVMLANTVPRHKVLLGKYLGAMITLTIPLIAGMLVSLIIVISSRDLSFDPAAWLRVVGIALLSLLYLSLFVLLGMFVSARTARSPNAMAILLLVWVAFVILLPSLCGIVFEISHRKPAATPSEPDRDLWLWSMVAPEEPTAADLQRRLAEVTKQIWDNSEKFGKNAGCMSRNLSDPMNNPPARARLQKAVTDARNEVTEDYHNQLLAQAFGRRNVARLSPSVIYQRAAEILAGTGIHRCVSLYEQIKRYGADLKEFVRGKDLEDPQSLHLIGPERSMADSWRAISHDPVDFDAIPKFQERDFTLGESLRLAVWDIGLLGLLNLGLFAAAFVSFLRYDVR